MILRIAWAIAVLGCGGDAPSARARVLDKLPAGVTSLVVADGRALTKLRPFVDVLRAEVPAGLDCVVDAALAGQEVAAGVTPSGDITVALASRSKIECPALSQVEDGLYIATLGGGAPGAGALAEQPRARPFLLDAPVALVTRLGAMRVIGTAKPDPLVAWVSFDAPDAAAATAFQAELQRKIGTLPVTVDRMGSQVVARLNPTTADLAALLRTVLSRPRDPARVLACPSPLTPPVLACAEAEHDVNKLDVYSLASATDELLAASTELVIWNGRVEGVRFRDDLPIFGLASGDLLVAIDGQQLAALDDVAAALARAKVHVKLLVSRARQFGTIELVEH